ncbi:MAG: hypothetical protein M1153_01495 [Patescibacteria group bacterium]|nr:hypothetical protein [Patescibacteria group bacterium]
MPDSGARIGRWQSVWTALIVFLVLVNSAAVILVMTKLLCVAGAGQPAKVLADIPDWVLLMSATSILLSYFLTPGRVGLEKIVDRLVELLSY